MAKRKRSSSEIEEAKTAAMAVSSKSELRHREKERKKAKSGGFESMGLCLEVYRGVKRKGYNVPTPIQRKTIPLILSGADVVAMARTGSGKTAAFLVPLLQRLRRHLPEAGIRALVLSPTRDLALQTLRFARDLGRFTDLRTSLLVGGDSMEDQFADLSHSSPDIIIATPGRLMHHLSEIDDGGFSLRSVEYTVFDEADSLFEMGFADQLRSILSHLGDSRQTLLFSATMPSALADFAKAGLRDPHLVRLDVDTKISPDLTLAFFTMRHEEKSAALLYLVRERISSDQQTLVFVSTKHHVEFLNLLFREEGIEPSVSYGDMDQDARKIHVSKFRSRKTMILIVTDVAARGIDIPLLDNVVNWDFPPKPKIFVHRVGRAARAGRTGTAYSFLTPDEIPYLLDLHLFLSKPVSPSPSEDQVLNDMENVLSQVDQAIARGETVYGRFPQATIDLVSERVREVIQDSAELIALQKACANAFRLYSKTKPLPSKDSINRAKDLSHEGLHPLFRDLLESNELTAIAFTEKLKSFRPRQTILEAETEAAKSNNLQGPGQWLEVMKKKRAVHEKIINLVRQKHLDIRGSKESKMDVKASHAMKTIESLSLKTNAKSFVDEENYISSIPKNQHTEAGLAVKGNEVFGSSRLDSAVCDLVADDSSGMQKQQQIYHWDKRGKKYIKLNNGERVTASGKIKTESGAKVKGEKTGIYKRWKEKTHNKISMIENSSKNNLDASIEGKEGVHGNRRNFKGGNKRWSIPNANVRDEIKNPEQIRKSRQMKATKIASFKSKSKKKFANKRKGGGKRKKS